MYQQFIRNHFPQILRSNQDHSIMLKKISVHVTRTYRIFRILYDCICYIWRVLSIFLLSIKGDGNEDYHTFASNYARIQRNTRQVQGPLNRISEAEDAI